MILAPAAGPRVRARRAAAEKRGRLRRLAEIARHHDRWYLYALFITAERVAARSRRTRDDRASWSSGRRASASSAVGWRCSVPRRDRRRDGRAHVLADGRPRRRPRPRWRHSPTATRTPPEARCSSPIGGMALIVGPRAPGRSSSGAAAVRRPGPRSVSPSARSSTSPASRASSNALVIASNVVLLAALGSIGRLLLAASAAGAGDTPCSRT